jgi:ribosomal-protein-alanine N-acetyltransferase
MNGKRIKLPGCHFTAVWEFHVRPDKRRAFERAYGPNGDWAKLFRSGEGYIRTELIRDRHVLGRYVSLDFWTSRLAYQKFRTQNLAAYKAIDKRCEALTQSEKCIGEFQKTVPAYLLPANTNWWRPAAPENFAIRQATINDVPAMLALSHEAPSSASWSESLHRDVFNPGAPARIALVNEHGRLLAGFVVARVNAEDCELENVVVSRATRRRGIGSKLVAALLQEARDRGVQRVFLEVRDSNSAARALYEKCGFEINGRRKSYYRDPLEDAALYTRQL